MRQIGTRRTDVRTRGLRLAALTLVALALAATGGSGWCERPGGGDGGSKRSSGWYE